jgi:hypothetical protein
MNVYRAYAAALALVLIGSTGTAFAQAAGHEVAPNGAPSIDTAPPEIGPAPEGAPIEGVAPSINPRDPGSATMAPDEGPDNQGPPPSREDQEP